MTRHKKNGLRSKVETFPKHTIKTAGDKRYIDYCDFSGHRGLIRRPHICDTRRCEHYYQLEIRDAKYKEVDVR